MWSEMTELEKLKKMTGEKDEGLLQILLEDAEAFVLSYTNRTHLVSGLDKSRSRSAPSA